MKHIILGLALIAAPTVAQASPASAQQDAATRLMDVMDLDRALEKTFSGLAPLYGKQVVAEFSGKEETRSFVQKVTTEGRGGRERLEAILSEEFLIELRKSYPDLKAEVAKGYRSQFTPEELEELIRFLSTGTGAKYIALQPQIEKSLEGVGEQLGMKVAVAALPRAMERIEAEMLR